MFATVYAAIAAAILFYAVLPVIGALVVRRQWRNFRQALAEAVALPELRYGMSSKDGQRLRLTGRVDAIGGDDELWICSESVTASVSMGKSWVYTLSGDGGKDGSGDEMSKLHWKSIGSVAPGTRAMVAGEASFMDGKTVIGPRAGLSLIILYDGSDERMPERAMLSGRHSNEYWNPLTQVSIAIGILATSGILSISLSGRAPAMASALILTAAFSPLLPLLPPGLPLFFAYRFYWKRGRECRARRDLAALRHDARAWRAWRSRSAIWTGAAIVCFAAALLANAWLALAGFRSLL